MNGIIVLLLLTLVHSTSCPAPTVKSITPHNTPTSFWQSIKQYITPTVYTPKPIPYTQKQQDTLIQKRDFIRKQISHNPPLVNNVLALNSLLEQKNPQLYVDLAAFSKETITHAEAQEAYYYVTSIQGLLNKFVKKATDDPALFLVEPTKPFQMITQWLKKRVPNLKQELSRQFEPQKPVDLPTAIAYHRHIVDALEEYFSEITFLSMDPLLGTKINKTRMKLASALGEQRAHIQQFAPLLVSQLENDVDLSYQLGDKESSIEYLEEALDQYKHRLELMETLMPKKVNLVPRKV